VVVGRSDRPGYLAGKLSADGQYHDALGIYTGGTARPATPGVVNRTGAPVVEFVRKFPATFNSEHWPRLIGATLDKAGLKIEGVGLFVFTQLNARTIETVMEKLGVPMSRTHMVMDKWGYLGSACIPVAFDDALQMKALAPGSPVVFCATGGGLAMSCTVWNWWGPADERRVSDGGLTRG
jgi:3-oxoacyl-[acyl-carrier-protein] synthase-3